VRGKSIVPDRVNEKIARNDLLKTGANSSLGVALRDDTLIALGSNSEVNIRDFSFSPGEGKLKLFVKVAERLRPVFFRNHRQAISGIGQVFNSRG